jgi:RNA polymerase sigma-70 factor (ECF subfamily)
MRAFTTPSDEDLLRGMRSGDEQAFVVLYRRRQSEIYRYALHMSGSTALAEEVTQEVFMALIRDSKQFDPERGPLLAYLYGVARHQVLRRIERDRTYVPLETEDLDRILPAKGSVAEDLLRREAVDTVRRAVLSLPANYREVVVLCDLQEMTYEQAAGLLECAVGTVRSRLHRGRALLATKLRPRLPAAVAVRCLA